MQPSTSRLTSALRTCAPFSTAVPGGHTFAWSQLRGLAATGNGAVQAGAKASEHNNASVPKKHRHSSALQRRHWRPSLFSLMDEIDAQMGLTMDPFNSFATQFETPLRTPLVDMYETEDYVEIHADLPGVAKKDIKIDYNKDMLTLSVQQQTAKEDSGDEDGNDRKWYRSERSRAFLQRSIRLPEHADGKRATAKLQDGILSIQIPKMPEKAEGTEIAVQ